MRNAPDLWDKETVALFADEVLDAIFPKGDRDPRMKEPLPDPVEPWESWVIQFASHKHDSARDAETLLVRLLRSGGIKLSLLYFRKYGHDWLCDLQTVE